MIRCMNLFVLLAVVLAAVPSAASHQPAEFAGRYRVVFDSREGPAVATLRLRDDGSIEGTFMTPTGDDGLLTGVADDDRLVLRPADGSAGPVYDGSIDDAGTYSGTLTWASGSRDTFTAVRSPEARLPDLYGLTAWNEDVDAAELVFRDTDGVDRRLGDFAPAPAIVYIFGTWCHNCSDATRFLNTLHERYADRRLSIVGVAFETPTEFAAQAEAVRRYADTKSVGFPLLVAGQRDKSDATRVLGALDRVRAYPTFAFVAPGKPLGEASAQNRTDTNRVVAVHQGFIGPAAPETHAALTASFVEQIEAMLTTPEDADDTP